MTSFLTKTGLMALSLTSSNIDPSSNSHAFLTSSSPRFASIPTLFQKLPLPEESLPNALPPPLPHPNPNRKLKPTYAIILSYNGMKFPGGWEHNPKLDVATVQNVLSSRLSSILGTPTNLSTAGRTDAYVSAKAALMSISIRTPLPETTALELNAVNRDGDITVHEIVPVHASFHAAFGTTAREYVYVVPLYRNETFRAPHLATVVDGMLGHVVGKEMDYFGMSHGKVKTKTTLCTLHRAECRYCENSDEEEEEGITGFRDCWRDYCRLEPEYGGCLVFRIKADRFLRRMMRKTVNSVLQEASSVLRQYEDDGDGCRLDEVVQRREEWQGQWQKRVENRDRSGNQGAPSLGLCLWRVEV